jgi:hypothetical protein
LGLKPFAGLGPYGPLVDGFDIAIDSGLARICGRTTGGLELTSSAIVEVAHSSAAVALALCQAGPGFPSRFVEKGIRSFRVSPE